MPKNLHMSKKSITFAPKFKNLPKMNDKTKQILKVVISVLIAALTALAAGLGLSSCNVTRVVTNESRYYQKGDTAVTIQTKIVETYDAHKNK